ncbi:MAG: hypothetical protein EOO77_41520 [Oxalobacteraceae bacterium]|nr:MAG: hypothetical protein EOO77_41520 [Oxalobacteraceae bacterium]
MGFFSKIREVLSGRSKSGPTPNPMKIDTPIDEILASPAMCNEMVIFSKSEFSEENPKFLIAVKHAHALLRRDYFFTIPIKAMQAGAWIPPEHRGSQATMGAYLYDTYINLASTSQVNIGSGTFAELQAISQSPGRPFTLENFDNAANEVSQLLKRDTLPRLISTRSRAAGA